MENLKFHRKLNQNGKIAGLVIGGNLVLENSKDLKKELIGALDLLNHHVEIIIDEPEEIDLSCIQLLVALIRRMNELKVTYLFKWILSDDQRLLLENVGLSNELFLND